MGCARGTIRLGERVLVGGSSLTEGSAKSFTEIIVAVNATGGQPSALQLDAAAAKPLVRFATSVLPGNMPGASGTLDVDSSNSGVLVRSGELLQPQPQTRVTTGRTCRRVKKYSWRQETYLRAKTSKPIAKGAICDGHGGAAHN